MADVLRHEQCPQCAANGNDNSRDNMAVYSDGGKHCFACGYHVHGTEDWEEENMSVENIKDFSEEAKQKIKDITSTKGKGYRGLDDKITGPFGVRYEYDESTGAVAKQYYPVTIKGELSGYKIRKHPKSFLSIGETGRTCDLFGQFKFKQAGKYVLLVGGECFPGEVEVLTEKGFVRFDELEKGSKVYQHSFDLGQSGFVVPYAYTEKEYSGELVNVTSSVANITCTPDHNLVFVTQKGEVKVQPAKEHFSKGWSIPTVTNHSGVGISLTDEQISLIIAICADSKIDKRVNSRGQVHFEFIKQRKIERLTMLLESLGISYTTYTSERVKTGQVYTTFNFKLPDFVEGKMLPKSWLADATCEQQNHILDEIILWDGNLVKGRNAFEFSSKHLDEASFVQSLAVLNGRYAGIRKRNNHLGEWYAVKVSNTKMNISCQSVVKSTSDYNGKVYCVSVPSGMIVTRNSGKIAIVGNCDQLSAYQMLREYQLSKAGGEDYAPIAVVSPTIGENCKKQIQKQYDFLNQFERIIVGFDNDNAGRKATEDVIDVLPRGKVWIANWNYKDPNEYLVNGKSREFVRDFYNAEKHTPAGVIASDKIFEEVLKRAESDKLPFAPFLGGLNEMLAGGITYGFIVNILAGSGCGKSALINENVIHWTKKLNVKVGVVSLEADAGYYGEQLLSRYIGKKIALIDNKEDKVKLLTSEETKQLAHDLFTSEDGSPSFYILDDRGDFSQLQEKIEELVVAFGVRVIIIDVISDVFAGMTIEQVDKWMQWEKCLVKQYNCILVNIAHVRKASGGEQAGSQGAFLTEESILGSGSQFRSAGINISLQRDKNAEDEIDRNTTYVHLLKSRDTGMTGKACEVFYDLKSHTLYDKEYYFSHVEPPQF